MRELGLVNGARHGYDRRVEQLVGSAAEAPWRGGRERWCRERLRELDLEMTQAAYDRTSERADF